MVEKLRAEFGNRIDIDAEIEAMKRKNDAEIGDFIEWKSEKMAMREIKITSFVETSLVVATCFANKFNDRNVEINRDDRNVETHNLLV